MGKRKTFKFGTIMMSLICLFTGVFFLLWGTWIYLSGYGTRPAGLEYLLMIFGVFFTIGAIIIIVSGRFLVFSANRPKARACTLFWTTR